MGLQQAIELHRAGRYRDAEAAYRRVIAEQPSNAEALNLLGMLLAQSERVDQGLDLLRRSIELSPQAPELLNNFAAALGGRGRHSEAAEILEESLRLRPGQQHALYNLGVAHEHSGNLQRASGALREAISRFPTYAEAHNALGNVLRKAGRNEQALKYHSAAVHRRPNYAEAFNALATVYGELGRQVEATACRRKVVELRPDSARDHSDLLYDIHYDGAVSAEEIYEEHLRWARRHAEPLTGWMPPASNSREAGRRLKVGYVSSDFRGHPIARFQEAVLAHHDREAFEVFCYSGVEQADAVTARMRAYADQWRDVRGLDDERLAGMIRDDRIDVLVDLTGHAAGDRLLTFARRPAPVQVTCNGYVNTTGMSAMGYRLTDALHDPPGMTDHLHTERLVRLPGCNWCYRPDDNSPDVLPSPRLNGTGVTFGSLNKLYKATPQMASLWAQILRQVPGSRLVLVMHGEDRANPSVRESLVRLGIPSDRLKLLGKARSRDEYLARFSQIDIALDTFPFNGITTTCDALWMGVPVVSLYGKTHVSRAGLSILSRVGLRELACTDPDEYVSRAVQLAGNRARLSGIREGLRPRMERSPLRDERAYAAAVEAAYRQMWRSWCSGVDDGPLWGTRVEGARLSRFRPVPSTWQSR
jgi:protein O-GlcNAc transferase